MISSELPEVLRISDRILVMREGRLMTELAHADASEEEILSAATGQAPPPAPPSGAPPCVLPEAGQKAEPSEAPAREARD
jgi:energy-coupling factor transporter ATP-binding protein EcfA2